MPNTTGGWEAIDYIWYIRCVSIEVWSGISGLFGLHAKEECVQSDDRRRGIE